MWQWEAILFVPQCCRKLPGLFAILYCIVTNTVPNQCNDCRSLQWCPDSGMRWVCREQITKQKNKPAFQFAFCFGRQLLGNECSWRWERKLLQYLNSLSNSVNLTNSGTIDSRTVGKGMCIWLSFYSCVLNCVEIPSPWIDILKRWVLELSLIEFMLKCCFLLDINI